MWLWDMVNKMYELRIMQVRSFYGYVQIKLNWTRYIGLPMVLSTWQSAAADGGLLASDGGGNLGPLPFWLVSDVDDLVGRPFLLASSVGTSKF